MVLGGAGRTGSCVAAHLYAAYHQVRVLVRDPHERGALSRLGRLVGGTPGPGVRAVAGDLLGDPEQLVRTFRGCDVVINAAGTIALHGQGPVVDGEGGVAAVQAARAAGVRRFVQISMMFADRSSAGPDGLRELLVAKNEADAAVMASGLDWTVIRPGPLNNEVPTGHVATQRHLTATPGLPREDLAAVAAVCLSLDSTVGLAFDVTFGGTPILSALAQLAPVDA